MLIPTSLLADQCGSSWAWNNVIADNATNTVLLFEGAAGENGTGIWSTKAQVAAQAERAERLAHPDAVAPTTLHFMVLDYFLATTRMA